MKKIFSLILFSISALLCSAQQDLTLYNMNSINQSNEINPSLMPANRYYVGLPVINSVYLLYSNNSFTYRDFFTPRSADDSVELDISNAISKLDKSNFLTTQFRTNLLSFGFKVKKNYFSVNATERINFSFSYPKELFELIEKGNGNFIGQKLDFSKMGFDATHFREYGIGWTREIGNRLTMGIRLKYLYGMENFSSKITDLNLTTNDVDYGLELNTNITINTSSPMNNTDGYGQFDNTGWGSYMTKLKNRGYGTDLSATYKLNDKWEVNTSVLDLGFIQWNSDIKNFVTNAGRYYFDGVNISDFFSDDSSNSGVFLDTLSETYNTKENSDSYTTNLTTHFYLGTNYKINNKSFVTGMVHGYEFMNNFIPSFTLGYNIKVGNHLSLATNYSYINHNFNNIGLGLSTSAGPIQLYATTDNIVGTLYPLDNNTSHVHFGLNLIFGRPHKGKNNEPAKISNNIKTKEPKKEKDNRKEKDKDNDGVPDKVDRCPDVFGIAELDGCPDKDGDDIPDVDDNCPEVKGPAKSGGCPQSEDNETKNTPAINTTPQVSEAQKSVPQTPAEVTTSPVINNEKTEVTSVVETTDDEVKAVPEVTPQINAVPSTSNKEQPKTTNTLSSEDEQVINKAFKNLEFEQGESVIRKTSYESLDGLADLLKEKPSFILLIQGHTDNEGGAAFNLVLSINRSEEVKKYLISKGVSGKRITAIGFGSSKPLVPNTTAEGRKKNRRVEFVIK